MKSEMNWLEAENACKIWGGHLVRVHSAKFNEFLKVKLEKE